MAKNLSSIHTSRYTFMFELLMFELPQIDFDVAFVTYSLSAILQSGTILA